ncbi:alpha-ketoglutarate-dependent 2-4-dichlorophenoxyacetate dioxygenase [Apiospora sp. TS-2023a]
MPDTIETPSFKTIQVKELHPTFAAEVTGVNFQHVSDEQFAEILAAMAKYGVCVFRKTGLTDESHVAFSRRFGELDNIRRYLVGGRKPRYGLYELFDAGNLTEDNQSVLDPDSVRAHSNKGNGLWHVDSSFNPRRAGFSLLRACILPPPGHGGNTDFADSRTAFEELPPDLKTRLLEHDYVGAHSMAHSRKLGSPEFFKDMDVPSNVPMYRHRIVQEHGPSGRTNLYIGTHMHHLEDLLQDKDNQAQAHNNDERKEIPGSWDLIQTLHRHATQPKYQTSVEWRDVGDLVIWDNRCVLHKAGGGRFEGRFKRDLRRTTVHDDGPHAWGVWPGFNTFEKPKAVSAAAAVA